jgi:hypothetical protein
MASPASFTISQETPSDRIDYGDENNYKILVGKLEGNR